jgi:hypothetical protein
MINIWYQNPEILLNDLNEFIPNKKLSKPKNINSIARFAIYFSIIILILRLDLKWLLLSIIVLFISYYLSITNNFLDQPIINKEQPIKNDQPSNKSTIENPFMNYITNNRTTPSSNSFSQLLPKNLSINSDPVSSLNLFVNNQENFENTLPTNNSNISPTNNSQCKIPSQSIPLNLYSNNQNISILEEKNKLPPSDNQYVSINNTINYDLCLTSNSNKSCSPDNKIVMDPDGLPK